MCKSLFFLSFICLKTTPLLPLLLFVLEFVNTDPRLDSRTRAEQELTIQSARHRTFSEHVDLSLSLLVARKCHSISFEKDWTDIERTRWMFSELLFWSLTSFRRAITLWLPRTSLIPPRQSSVSVFIASVSQTFSLSTDMITNCHSVDLLISERKKLHLEQIRLSFAAFRRLIHGTTIPGFLSCREGHVSRTREWVTFETNEELRFTNRCNFKRLKVNES